MEPTAFHRVVQVKDFWMDVSKLDSLGFVPSIPFRRGLEQLCLT
jgi:hypothetical protein